MKHAFNRPRPTIVPHLRDVFSTSFPSGHAMESAIVYLTLGAILMRVAEDRVTKVYCLGIAVLLTVLVGVEPRLPGRPLPDRRHRRLDHRLRVGVDLLAGGGAIRGRPPASWKRKPRRPDLEAPVLHKIDKIRGFHILAADGEIGHVDEFLVDERDWSVRYWWSIPATGSVVDPCSSRARWWMPSTRRTGRFASG